MMLGHILQTVLFVVLNGFWHTLQDPRTTFDMYINTCPNQGSRTIRSEEAILISLSYLQPALTANAAAGQPL